MEDFALKSGFTGLCHFTDDGISDTTFEREGLRAMLAEVEKGSIGTIIVQDMSRLGRNYVQMGMLREKLRGIAKNSILRHRLSTALRDSFNWPDSDKIRFYSDFAPHSFFFREFRGGEAGICGGLILHDHGCPQEARYSIHT